MKLTSVEHTERTQLVSGVGQTIAEAGGTKSDVGTTTDGVTLVHVEIDRPKAGWSALRIGHGAEAPIEVVFSYSPEDSIDSFAESVDAVVTGPCERIVLLHEEPATVDPVLNRSSADSAVTVTLVRYPDHRRHLPGDVVLSLQVAPLEFGRAVWRALRQLEVCGETADYEREWRHPFPTRVVSLLGSRLA